MRVCFYLIKRTDNLLGYVEYLGPLPSTPHSIKWDAVRLFHKLGTTISWSAWSKATKRQKQEALENT